MTWSLPKCIAFLVLLVLAGCCGDNQAATARARGLSQQRLSQLYSQVGTLRESGRTSLTAADIPVELADLKPEGVYFHDSTVWIHLSGCVDDKVYLFLHGYGEELSSRSIVLSLGESKPQELLWQPRR